MPYHWQKRRRTDNALHKPFKSPLKQPNVRYEEEPYLRLGHLGATHSSENTVASYYSKSTTGLAILPFKGDRLERYFARPLVIDTGNCNDIVFVDDHSRMQSELHDPVIRTLNDHIRGLSIEIDDLQQTRNILSIGRNDEIETLVYRWRNSCRQVAEQLFEHAKDRTSLYGGVKAWQDQGRMFQVERTDWQKMDMVETAKQGQCPSHGDGGLDNDAHDEHDVEYVSVKQEMTEELHITRKASRGKSEVRLVTQQEHMMVDDLACSAKQEQRELNDDVALSIDIILQAFNIDFILAGYDSENQRWKD